MMKNNVFLSVVSIIIIFVFLFIVYAVSNKGDSTTQTAKPQLQKILPTDHTKWAPNQKNVLTEFTDFQCPACGSFHQLLKTYEASGSAESKVASKITFVHKNFPLEQIHKNARVAAYAAEAAGNQGKFFEMNDMLFENQVAWSEAKDPEKIFLTYATALELNLAKFKKDAASPEVKKIIDDDLILGNQVGVNSTPSFYLNGRKLEDGNLDEFKKLLSDAVATK